MNKVSLLRACNITTGKKDSNAATKNGKYLFFTCAPEPLRINSFCFDDDVILLAGNNAGGNFHCQRYKGKFDAYQRTYILTAKEGYYLDFVYYSLIINLKQYAKKSQGSQTKFLTMKILQEFEIDEISFDEQKNIANRLKSIDSKIKNNITINAELESMAKTLYDYWFLQFEFPNENGKPYKSSGGKMVWSEELKREIPEGWTESTLSEISNMYQPNTFDAKLLEDDGKYRVYGAGGYMGQYHDFNHKESEIFISCRGSCGDIYRSMPFSLITGNAMIVHPNNIYLFEYLYLTLQRIGVKNCITGSVQPQITRTSLNDWKLVVPSEKVVRHFKSIVEPIFKKQETIIEENSKLNSLRDFLLPMLMNGQVKFKD